MAQLNRNVNFGLMLLLIAAILLFSAFTVFYQKNYSDLSTTHETKIAEINKLIDELNSERSRLNQTSFQLKIKAEQEQDLSGKYEGLRDVKDQLEEENIQLQSQLTNAIADAREAEAEVEQKESTISTLSQEIGDLEDRVDSLERSVGNKNDEIDALCSKLKDYNQSEEC